MIRDTLRALLAVFVMAAAAALLLEVRYNLAAIDLAHRQALAGMVVPQWQAAAPPPPGPLRQLGRSAIDLADAALGVIR